MNAHAVNLLAKVAEFYDPSGIIRNAVRTISQSIVESGKWELKLSAEVIIHKLQKEPQVKHFEEYLADYAQCPAVPHEISHGPTDLTNVPVSGSVFCSRLAILAPLAVFLLFLVLYINRRNAFRMSRYEIYDEMLRKAHYARDLLASRARIITVPLWPAREHDIREGTPEPGPESPPSEEEQEPIASQEEISHYGAVAAKGDLSSEQSSSSNSRSRSVSPLNSVHDDDVNEVSFK